MLQPCGSFIGLQLLADCSGCCIHNSSYQVSWIPCVTLPLTPLKCSHCSCFSNPVQIYKLLSYSVTDGSGSILAILDAITDIRALYQANETQQNDQSSTLWSEARVSLKEENREQQLPVLPGPEPVLEHHERPAHAETIRNHQHKTAGWIVRNRRLFAA